MIKYDLHVATENSDIPEFERRMLELGLRHDGLLDRHVDFYGNVTVSACPLIGLHLTKKYDHLSPSRAASVIRSDIETVENLLNKYEIVGYAHAEATRTGWDKTIKTISGFSYSIPWPVSPFSPCFSEDNKKWDIHIAIPIDCLFGELLAVLEQSGMYSIDLEKTRNGEKNVFRIFTVQGVSAVAKGKELFDAMVNWFTVTGAPHVEIKCETYVAMVRVGSPMIVPPVIDHVEFLESGIAGFPVMA